MWLRWTGEARAQARCWRRRCAAQVTRGADRSCVKEISLDWASGLGIRRAGPVHWRFERRGPMRWICGWDALAVDSLGCDGGGSGAGLVLPVDWPSTRRLSTASPTADGLATGPRTRLSTASPTASLERAHESLRRALGTSAPLARDGAHRCLDDQGAARNLANRMSRPACRLVCTRPAPRPPGPHRLGRLATAPQSWATC